MVKLNNKIFLYFVAVGLFFPIFFQLGHGIFKTKSLNYLSDGSLLTLPIPLSAVVCFVSLILFGNFSKVKESLIIISITLTAMISSAILLVLMSGHYQLSKLILLIQFILPMFALVVGQQFAREPEALNILAKVFFGILVIIVPFQLCSTLMTGLDYLSSSVFVFNIYQHLQYVPIIFVSMFLFIIFADYQSLKVRRYILILSLLMGAYVGFSASMIAIGLLIAGTSGYLVYKLIIKNNYLFAISNFVLILIGFFIFFAYISNPDLLRIKFADPNRPGIQEELLRSKLVDSSLKESVNLNATGPKSSSVPANVTARISYWQFYISGIFSTSSAFAFGHLETPDRLVYPSAHNYYLDFIYNFGAIALIPLIVLLGFTIFKVFQRFDFVWRNPEVLYLVVVVLIILLIDNSLKVGLRQPYPGIISFFLWGVLLSILTDKSDYLSRN